MIDKLALAKQVVHFAVSASASKVVKDIISNNVTEPQNMADTVMVYTGSAALGAIVGDVTSRHVDAQADRLIAWFRSLRDTRADS